MSRFEKKLKGKMDNKIKLAGLEALVPEELEKHLILNSNRLRTFEDARLEIVTNVEAKFGLRIRDAKPSDTGLREHSDPTDVGAVDSLSSDKGKWSPGPRDGWVFQVRCRQGIVWQRQSEQVMVHDCPVRTKDPKVPKAHAKVKPRKLVSQVLKT